MKTNNLKMYRDTSLLVSTVSATVYSGLHLPAAFSPAGRSFLTTNPHETHSVHKKKVHFCNNSYDFSLFFLQSLIMLQNEQIFNRNCTKDSDSTSSKISLGKGPTPVIVYYTGSAFSTLSISSPIHTRCSISLSLSQRSRSGYTHQRRC